MPEPGFEPGSTDPQPVRISWLPHSGKNEELYAVRGRKKGFYAINHKHKVQNG